jgi:hypothetical protein
VAVFCLAVLLLVLGIVALLSLPQWGEDPVIPDLGVVPESGIGLDDAVAVARPQQSVGVARARLVGSKGPRLVTSPAAGTVRASDARTGLGAAQVVTTAVATRPPTGSPQSPPAESAPPPPQGTLVPVTTPVSAPVSSPTPVAAPTRPQPGGSQPQPIPSGEPAPGGVVRGPVEIYEGDEYVYAFSFYIQPSVYRAPGEDNLILRFGDEADQNHSLGLQLWDDGSGGQRGIWASGGAMGGERFLAPLTEGTWHDVVLYLQASSENDGLYLLLLDGEPIDTRAWVSLIDSAGAHGLLEAGLFREGERVEDTADVYFGPARLGGSLESVIP